MGIGKTPVITRHRRSFPPWIRDLDRHSFFVIWKVKGTSSKQAGKVWGYLDYEVGIYLPRRCFCFWAGSGAVCAAGGVRSGMLEGGGLHLALQSRRRRDRLQMPRKKVLHWGLPFSANLFWYILFEKKVFPLELHLWRDGARNLLLGIIRYSARSKWHSHLLPARHYYTPWKIQWQQCHQCHSSQWFEHGWCWQSSCVVSDLSTKFRRC